MFFFKKWGHLKTPTMPFLDYEYDAFVFELFFRVSQPYTNYLTKKKKMQF